MSANDILTLQNTIAGLSQQVSILRQSQTSAPANTSSTGSVTNNYTTSATITRISGKNPIVSAAGTFSSTTYNQSGATQWVILEVISASGGLGNPEGYSLQGYESGTSDTYTLMQYYAYTAIAYEAIVVWCPCNSSGQFNLSGTSTNGNTVSVNVIGYI